MKILKFLGWSMVGLVLLAGVAYGFLPAIGTTLITQGLTNRGFSNVEIIIDRPGTHTLTIPSLAFRTPLESGAISININNTEITYSLDSLLNNVVETVNIEAMRVIWDSSLLNRPSSQSPSSPPSQSDSQFDLRTLGSGAPLPVLPFQHLRVKQVDISNPLAPPSLQHISLNANMDARSEGYEGSVHLEGNGLLLNRLAFSLTPNGTVSLTGVHTNAPEDPVLDLRTSLERSASGLALQGQTTIKLHPIIHTLAALYPLRPEYQAVTGNFSGTWTGTLQEQPSQADSPLGPFQGNFTLDVHMPTWPPLAQDIQLLTKGTFSIEGTTLTVIVQPSSAGSVNLALDTVTPPAVTPFISHKGVRSLKWNILKPIHVVVPIKKSLDSVHVPSGQIRLAMLNASEQLDMFLSPQDLLWKPSSGVEGKAEVKISTNLKPVTTPALSLNALSLEAQATLSLSAGQIEVALNPTSVLHLSHVKNETMHIPTLEGRFPKGLSWIYHAEPHTWELQAADSTLVIPSLSLQGQQWELGEILTKDLLITATPERWEVIGESSVTQVQSPMTAFKIPSSNWQARYAVNPSAVTVQFNGHMLEHPVHIGGQVKFNALTDEGSGTMTLKPIQFAPQTLVLSQLIQPWTYPNMDVTHGAVSASAEVTFRKAPNDPDKPFHLKHLHGIVDFKEMGGFFKPTIIEGLTTRVEILGKDETLRIPPTPLRIRNIQSAVGLTETALLFSTETFPQTSIPTLSITNMSTHLLGGKVFLADATIDPKAATHEVTLQVTGLDLNEILRLEQQETMKGTGTLDGTLPLFISRTESSTAITVQQGSLQGRPPGGTLQFEVDKETANSWAESQPQLDLIVKSLENYHYSKLAVGVDYQKNGILTLATQLEGKNPDFRNGVPIHFNLNIEENIPALMKSLSLVKGLEENIEKMMTERNTSSTK
jgi:hypothetical protein